MIFCNDPFVVNDWGKVSATNALKTKLKIGDSEYKLGVGGLHSCEKKMTYFADAKTSIVSADVTSYYPFIILNTKMFPFQLGPVFLDIYRQIVEKRLKAKRANQKTISR